MNKTRNNGDSSAICDNRIEHRASVLALASPPPSEFIADALPNWSHIIRFALIAAGYELGGAQSLQTIAHDLYDAPRKHGAALPDYADPVLVRIVGGRLDLKRLSVALLGVDNLFAKHYGMGRLVAGRGEGMPYDHVTHDGKMAARVVNLLISHWVYLEEPHGDAPRGGRRQSIARSVSPSPRR